MPIYEYSCSKCGLKFELLRAMSQSSKAAACPTCGGSAERMLSSFCRSSEGSLASGSGSACASCSATTCSSCSVSG